MNYKKYYTPEKLSSIIVNEISDCNPESVIDICCGSCNLLRAAHKRWNNAELYGVDIIDVKQNDIIYTRDDGRKYSKESKRRFELIVGNPPFGRLTSRGEYPFLFEGIFEAGLTSRLEIEMLLANLKLLKNDGILMIILPSSIVEGESYINLRRALASKYLIKKIIKLPKDSFGKCNINTYAVEFINNANRTDITLIGVLNSIKDKNITYNKINKVDIDQGYWGTKNEDRKDILDIKRGNFSSNSFVKEGKEVFHTAKATSGDDWKPSRRFVSNSIKNLVLVEDGDIIISRVGKSAGCWTRYNGKKSIPISDCLFRLKDKNGRIYSAIRNQKYSGPVKGVATQYITINDIFTWISSLMVD